MLVGTSPSAVELSIMINRYRDVEIGPCPVCAGVRDLSEMKSGVFRYRCRAAGAGVLKPGGPADSEVYEHYRRSELVVASHGDPDVLAALLQLRALRAAAGEDMGVPVGAEHFPYGHDNGRCWMRVVHAGDDVWTEQNDHDFTHDPKHRA